TRETAWAFDGRKLVQVSDEVVGHKQFLLSGRISQFRSGRRINRNRLEIIGHKSIETVRMLAAIQLVGAYRQVNDQTFEGNFGLVAFLFPVQFDEFVRKHVEQNEQTNGPERFACFEFSRRHSASTD